LKVRVKFKKEGSMRFIGHLDVMRFFQKMMRRADIPIAFSSGFSPHMIMSFASPLGIGLTSAGEYFDIEITEPIPSQKALQQMNDTTVDGIAIVSFIEISPEKKWTGMSILAGASYRVTILAKEDTWEMDISSMLAAFLAQPEIVVLKKTKRSEEMVNIKSSIYEIKQGMDSNSSQLVLDMTLSAGSRENLKPHLVAEAFLTFIDKKASNFFYHRTEMYANVGSDDAKELVSLESLGREII